MTLPHAPLAVPDSDPAAAPLPPPDSDDLICPAADIIDAAALCLRLDLAVATADDGKAVRVAAVRELGAARDAGNAALRAAFAARPRDARPLIRAQAWLTDGLILAALHVATSHLHPLPNPTSSERIAVLAVGGCGRAEMAPHSDVDLLFLTPYKVTPWAESVIESMLYMLWDLKL